jgi:hypothetical protein
MTKPSWTSLPRSRHIALTIGAGVIAALTAVRIVGAPPIPAAVGIAIAVAWLIRRAPRA